ncbi:MAG: imidazole glycerol phosphate synthase subunit HisF [Planctomycetota bacterium]
MLLKRIIPCLDCDAGRVVKGVNFKGIRDVGDPVAIAQKYEADGADELVFYDITASHEGRGIMAEVVRDVCDTVFMPVTVGGGIRTVDDATRLIQAGAEKVSLNSAAVARPELIREVSDRFGTCATVLGLDANRVQTPTGEEWHVFVAGGRKDTGKDVVTWAREAQELGAGEIVLNCMTADGTKAGYDLEMTKGVCEAVTVPVVASGGAGGPEDMVRVLLEAHADAALAASIFHFGTHPIPSVKRHLADAGVAVRL